MRDPVWLKINDAKQLIGMMRYVTCSHFIAVTSLAHSRRNQILKWNKLFPGIGKLSSSIFVLHTSLIFIHRLLIIVVFIELIISNVTIKNE